MIPNFGFAGFLANRFVQTLALVIIALVATNTPVFAQSNVQGYIYGTVSGAGSGSVVTAVNNDTGLKRTAIPSASGAFNLASLPTGSYTVTLTTPGQPDQVSKELLVNLGSGTAVSFGATADQTLKLDKFVVSGSSISPIDSSSAESVTILMAQQIQQVPVERNSTAVALLAPGTSLGIAAFGNLASFGGSSVAENAYYVNGFNLTNFRNGLGGGSVPFEFYDQFEVKTGGYSAEFGRSTGGVINATTKSGSNTFKAGVNVYYEPDHLRLKSPNSVESNGSLYADNSKNYDVSTVGNVWASGPIIPNKVFFYGLYNYNNASHRDAEGVSTYYTQKTNNPFYGGKLDWNITDDHTISITGIKDKRRFDTNTSDYNDTTGVIGASHGLTYSDRGGHDVIANYVGHFSPDLTVTALYGDGTASESDFTGNNYIVDSRVSPAQILSGSSSLMANLLDTRKSLRVDLSYHYNLMGSHELRFGYDLEKTTVTSVTTYGGSGIYYRYYNTAPGKTVNGVIVPAGVTQYVREQIYGNNGNFTTDSGAYYIEDNWKLMDDHLLLSLGLRDDDYNNKNKSGQSFIHMKDQFSPRLAISYDINKDGRSKLFANFGRYSVPVATNTNVRFAGGETYTQDYFALNGVDPVTKLPTVGAQLGAHYVLPGEDGTVHDPKTIVNQDLKPMYQDEYIIGYQKAVNKDWTVGVRGIYREMTHFIEDVDVDLVPGDDSTLVDVLTNPGRTMVIWGDPYGTGTLKQYTLSPSQQGYAGQNYPLATRKYYAAEFFWEKINRDNWWLQGSYTWSHSYGNDEGSVLSDIAQTDAGITELFDWPQIMNGRYGNLSNDRRHRFKLFGAYSLSDEWQVAANFLLQSGAPKIAIGYWPGPDANLSSYGAAFFYVNGVVVPRGSLGEQPQMWQLDLSTHYTPKWGKKKLVFGLDVFNVFNNHTVMETYVYAESGGSGVVNPAYNATTVYQNPLYVRLSASYKY